MTRPVGPYTVTNADVARVEIERDSLKARVADLETRYDGACICRFPVNDDENPMPECTLHASIRTRAEAAEAERDRLSEPCACCGGIGQMDPGSAGGCGPCESTGRQPKGTDEAERRAKVNAALLGAARDFVAKVDTGRAHSKDSYAKFKAAIALAEQEPGLPVHRSPEDVGG